MGNSRNDARYNELFKRLDALCQCETDQVAIMATIACELYQAFEHFDWVGFYRNVGSETLKIGPYQGGHGCIVIPFDRGVCGKCAREQRIQRIDDVSKIPCHIACSASTKSEIVLPLFGKDDELIAVLDIDSNTVSAFDEMDEEMLTKINRYFRQEMSC